MKHEIKVPAMGESITEATINTILKPSGALVKMDDELLELATDKVNQVLYAPQNGVFTLKVKEDDVVKIGQEIGYIDDEAAAGAQATKPPEAKGKEAAPSKKAPVEAPKPAPTAAVPKGEPAKAARVTTDDYLSDLLAQPSMKEEKKDEKKPIAITAAAPRTAAAAQTEEREIRRKMSRIRKVIATKLVEVQNTTAMLTTFNEVDMTQVMDLREKYKDMFLKEHGVRLGFMPFFIKATVSALSEFPDINSYIDGDDLVQRQYYDIGIAVGSDKGLVVPVVRDCDRLSFAEMEKSIQGYAAKIKDGTLAADDLQGGGFTITNGGVYGSLLSTPILNPGQCGILGMQKIQKRPVVVDDQIAIRQMMYLALSYDHRIVDGKAAVSFLVHIKNCLEDPARLLLNI